MLLKPGLRLDRDRGSSLQTGMDHQRSYPKGKENGGWEQGLLFSIKAYQCREKEIDDHIQIGQFTLGGYFLKKIKNTPI